MNKKEQIKLEIIDKCKNTRKRIFIWDIIIVIILLIAFKIPAIAGIQLAGIFALIIALPTLVLINLRLEFINKAMKDPLKYKGDFKNLEANKLSEDISENDIKRITSVFEKLEQEHIPNILKLKDIDSNLIPLDSNTKLISSHEVVENLISFVAKYVTIERKLENIKGEELSENCNKFLKTYVSGSLNDEIEKMNSFLPYEINELANYLEYAWTYMWILGLYQGIPKNEGLNELLQILNKFENYDDLYNNCRFLDKDQILSISETLTITYINLSLAEKTLNKKMPNTDNTFRQMLATHTILSFQGKGTVTITCDSRGEKDE